MKKIIFRNGIESIHFINGFLPLANSNGDITINPKKEIEKFFKFYKVGKKVKVTYVPNF